LLVCPTRCLVLFATATNSVYLSRPPDTLVIIGFNRPSRRGSSYRNHFGASGPAASSTPTSSSTHIHPRRNSDSPQSRLIGQPCCVDHIFFMTWRGRGLTRSEPAALPASKCSAPASDSLHPCDMDQGVGEITLTSEAENARSSVTRPGPHATDVSRRAAPATATYSRRQVTTRGPSSWERRPSSRPSRRAGIPRTAAPLTFTVMSSPRLSPAFRAMGSGPAWCPRPACKSPP
jgi:hypothetical protein